MWLTPLSVRGDRTAGFATKIVRHVPNSDAGDPRNIASNVEGADI
jgi:hypothetical protein